MLIASTIASAAWGAGIASATIIRALAKEHGERYKQGASVTIRTKDGQTFSSTVYAPTGAGVRGIDWADVDAKYRTLVPRAQVRDRQVEASLQVIHNFRHVTHAAALINLLRGRAYTS